MPTPLFVIVEFKGRKVKVEGPAAALILALADNREQLQPQGHLDVDYAIDNVTISPVGPKIKWVLES